MTIFLGKGLKLKFFNGLGKEWIKGVFFTAFDWYQRIFTFDFTWRL